MQIWTAHSDRHRRPSVGIALLLAPRRRAVVALCAIAWLTACSDETGTSAPAAEGTSTEVTAVPVQFRVPDLDRSASQLTVELRLDPCLGARDDAIEEGEVELEVEETAAEVVVGAVQMVPQDVIDEAEASPDCEAIDVEIVEDLRLEAPVDGRAIIDGACRDTRGGPCIVVAAN